MPKKKTTKTVIKKFKYTDKEVKTKQKVLTDLQDKRKSIELEIKNICENYNSKSVNDKEAAQWLDRLPLETLKELEDFSAGRKHNFNLLDLKTRSDLRKNRNSKLEEFIKVNDEIYIGKIDLLLVKLSSLIKETENK